MSKKCWSAKNEHGKSPETKFTVDYEGRFLTLTSAAVVDANSNTVALVVDLNDRLTHTQFIRRAALIAAAPELLESLQELVNWSVKRDAETNAPLPTDQQMPEVVKAMLAIDKAYL